MRTVTLSNEEVEYLRGVFSELEHYMYISGCGDDSDEELFDSVKQKLIGNI